MLDFMTNIIVAILSGYLALTNSLASQIENWLPIPETAPVSQTELVTNPIDEVPKQYEYGGLIPDILIKNAAYQKAAVLDSQLSTTTPGVLTKAQYGQAIVNIYCTYKTESYVKISTGTGSVVSETGVILTNAHVAQFLLLENLKDKGTTNCVVRTGTNPSPTYEVKLLYISPKWIQDNATVISQASPKGTGERDYALLYVTKGINDQAVPAKLPFLPINLSALTKADLNVEVTIGGYPAKASEVTTDLKQSIATTTIAEVFTFVAQTPDIFNLRGSSIGNYGISGGPVINKSGQTIGLITTKSDDSKLGEGSLNAITMSYIDRTMKEETGFGLPASIKGNLAYRAELFKNTIVPFLTRILEKEL
jgi:hypothetical protein